MQAKQPSSWLLAQWKLMREATRDKRLTAVDHAVLLEILDRHLDHFGNAQASWTHLTRTTGRVRSAVAEAVGRLVSMGYLSIVQPGVGTRPTSYAPNWGYPSSEPLQRSTTSEPPGRTTLNRQSGPLSSVVDLHPGPHIHLPQPPTGALTVGGYSSESPTSAPPHAPAGAEVDAVGFERVWGAYGVRTKRAQAKAAFVGLGDVAEILDEIVASATRWREHYEAQGTPARYRKQLHTWLKGECYLEDPPAWKSAPPAKPLPSLVNRPVTAELGPQRCHIVSATLNDEGEGSVLSLVLQPATNGAPILRNLRYETWEAAEFEALLSATGLPANANELEGREVMVDGRWYLPVAANDNGEAAAAASP